VAAATWGEPIRVSANINTQAFVPAVAVDGHGDLAVAYYDFSADRPSSQFLATQYWITFSANQGHTWSARQQVTSQPFDLRTAPFQTHEGFFLGEYQGLAGIGQRFVVAATFTNGYSLDNRTDIYSATVAAPSRWHSRVVAPGRLIRGCLRGASSAVPAPTTLPDGEPSSGQDAPPPLCHLHMISIPPPYAQ